MEIQHPDDDPVCAFRELIEKLSDQWDSREELAEMLDDLSAEVMFGSEENLRYLEDFEELEEMSGQ